MSGAIIARALVSSCRVIWRGVINAVTSCILTGAYRKILAHSCDESMYVSVCRFYGLYYMGAQLRDNDRTARTDYRRHMLQNIILLHLFEMRANGVMLVLHCTHEQQASMNMRKYKCL